ncbi:MAG: cytochrome P450 [Deltaproteobacteria bacterium]|jgi:cytochrome P450|nr:cytochrome P450 [Deltaproteobacteria bacterium]
MEKHAGNGFENRFGLPELAFDQAFFRSPHEQLARLRADGARAVFLPRMGTIMLLGYADVHDALLDRNLGAIGSAYYEQQGWSEGPYIEWLRRTVVFLDPPDHDRLRALLSRAFTPRQVARVRPITERIASQLADRAAESGRVDLYDAFAQKLPLQVICEVIGIPSVDFEQMGRWTEALSVATGYPSLEARKATDEAMVGLSDYSEELIQTRRAAPADDLLSALIEVEEEGDRLSPEELVAMIAQMLYAGHETTRNLIGNGLFCLLEHPDQLVLLRRDPGLIEGAVEEMLRYEPPIIYLSRVVQADCEIAGIGFEAGSLMHVSLSSANRDPARFDEPDRFDVTRPDNRHLSFGFGAHFCLGASIARMEGRVAFETLLARFASIEWAGGEPSWADDTALRTLEAFPVALRAA